MISCQMHSMGSGKRGHVKLSSCSPRMILLEAWTTKARQTRSCWTFPRAFDKVPHKRLLLKVACCAIAGSILAWIEDFLHSRTQKVVLEGQSSSWAPVSSGMPQGSVLGPLLFLLYINDLPDCVTSSTTRLFADDTVVYRRITSHGDADALQSDINALQQWMDTWLMQFNASKCQVLRVTL